MADFMCCLIVGKRCENCGRCRPPIGETDDIIERFPGDIVGVRQGVYEEAQHV